MVRFYILLFFISTISFETIAQQVPKSKKLKEVEVTAERSLMQVSAEKKVFNVEKNITTAGGTAADVLQNVPSLSIDVDGDVLLRGKETNLLIDGKPAAMFGGDVASALQSLPASAIESVEVITNPSAKYDAQGKGGIVNIITKRDKKFGFNGSVTAGVGTRNKYNGSINLNLRNNKWNIFLNSNYKVNKNYIHHRVDRSTPFSDTAYHTYEDNTRLFSGWFNTIGAEYSFNKKNSMTLTENINVMQWGGDGYSDYRRYAGNIDNLISRQYRTNQHLGGPFSSSTSLDYKHKFAKEKQELTGNATFSRTVVERSQKYTTRYYDNLDNEISTPLFENAPGSGSSNSFTGNIDFTTPFLTKHGRLDAGLKTQLYNFESSNDPTKSSAGVVTTDSVLLNSFVFNQQTHAAYTTFNDQKGKWSYQAGLRLEDAVYTGADRLSNKDYSTSFINLFPSAFISYSLPKDQSLFLNYSRRTNRPGFMQLVPFVDLSNPQDTSVGNPKLIPEFINNTELSYSRQFKKGHSLMGSLYYQYTENMIERYRKAYDNGTTYTQPRNLNSGSTYGAEVTGKAQILPIWDMMLNLNFFENRIAGTNIDPAFNNNGFSWFGKLNTNIKLPAGFSFQLNANYEAPKVAGQGKLDEVYWIDAALRKNLLKNKATIVLNVSDIFNTRKYTSIYNYPSYAMTDYRDKETRVGNITFTYRFGRSDMGRPDKGQGGRRRQNGNNWPEKDKERQNLKTDDNNEPGGQ
jgi:iron complex outermembrane receptor protein